MFEKILAPIDGSDPAKHALDYAVNLANNNKAELIVLSVVPHIHLYFSEDIDFSYYPKLQEDVQKSHMDLLEITSEELQREHEGLKMKTILKKGNPAKNIVETAIEEKVDLIVIGNRGTGGLLSWMLGSTSRNVVEACTVPVLVVKDQQYCEAAR